MAILRNSHWFHRIFSDAVEVCHLQGSADELCLMPTLVSIQYGKDFYCENGLFKTNSKMVLFVDWTHCVDLLIFQKLIFYVKSICIIFVNSIHRMIWQIQICNQKYPNDSSCQNWFHIILKFLSNFQCISNASFKSFCYWQPGVPFSL